MSYRQHLKVIISGLAGNILEWFDFAVYGYLAPILAGQFFPVSSKLASILLTYSVFALGFLVRPIGSILYGHIGDTRGRKTALILSSLGMAIPTFLIGVIPNYQSIGIAAPILLIVCRIFQGLSIGGEFTGSFVYLIEQATARRKGFFSCWPDIGCTTGMILGSVCVAVLSSVLSSEQLFNYGWRLPFLSAILLAAVAAMIRLSLPESKEFARVENRANVPIKEIILKFRESLIFSILLSAINAMGFYLLVVFIPNQAVLLGEVSASNVYLINTIVLLVVTFATFISASACDYFNNVKVYRLGPILCLLFGFPVFYALSHFTLVPQIFLLCFFAMGIGFCFGPRSLFMIDIFPARLRFTGIAIAVNVANAIFGGMSPLAATYLVAKTSSLEIPAILVVIAAGISLFSIQKLVKLKKNGESD